MSTEDLFQFDNQGKRFAVSASDVEKVNSDSGCEIKLRGRNRVLMLDDDTPSDYESDGDLDEGLKFMTNQGKLSSLKVEYLSMVLNANRDPSKPGPDSTESSEPFIEDPVGACLTVAEKHLERIRQQYSKPATFETLLEQQEDPFVKLASGNVFKRVLSGGLEIKITDTSVVAYNCALWSENCNEPFDSTWLRHQTIVTDLEEDHLMPGLRELLLTCKKNEWCEAIIRPDAAFGRLGAMPRIPPNATIFCLLEIVKVIPRDQLPPVPGDAGGERRVTFQDLYDASDLARKRGNYYHDQKQYKAAMQRYKTGIRILEAITYKDEKEENKANELLSRLYVNAARVCCLTGSCRLALSFCKEALMLDPTNMKIYHNKMRAWDLMGHTERALHVARRAMELSKDKRDKVFKSFEREMMKLKEKLIKDEKDRANLYKLMSQACIK